MQDLHVTDIILYSAVTIWCGFWICRSWVTGDILGFRLRIVRKHEEPFHFGFSIVLSFALLFAAVIMVLLGVTIAGR